jgi:hypothetical protein
MPDGTNFQMAACAYGTNEDYRIHVIAVQCIIEQKGMASDIKVAWEAMAKVGREIRLINLKGKEFVFGGSKNSNRTDCIAEKSLCA